MTLHYYKFMPEEEVYETWFYSKGSIVSEWHGEVGAYEDGWTKKNMPDNLNDKGKLLWYMASNQEDIHFIDKESDAMMKWMEKEVKEITISQDANKKMYKSIYKEDE